MFFYLSREEGNIEKTTPSEKMLLSARVGPIRSGSRRLMTPLEGPATPGMTDDNGDRPATADLAMTDDCRVGCGSTVGELMNVGVNVQLLH